MLHFQCAKDRGTGTENWLCVCVCVCTGVNNSTDGLMDGGENHVGESNSR